MSDVGPLIRALRKDANETLEELATALGKPASTVSRWENGKIKPTAEVLVALAQRYRVTFTFGPHGVHLGYLGQEAA